MAEEPGGKHPRVVRDEQLSLAQKARQIADNRVFDVAGVAGENEQTRGSAWQSLLSDQLFRQLEIEIGNIHRGRLPSAFILHRSRLRL